MKIITLLPVKNESWVLRFSLKNFSIFSDEIIILDDGSSDGLSELVREYPKVKIFSFKTTENHVDMSLRRTMLLREGRRSGGTHFIFLDADEIFSDTFSGTLRENIASMRQGETSYLPWIFVRQDNGKLYFDASQKTNYKDFIFCDDGRSVYEKQFLSEARTPGDRAHKLYTPFEKGYVLHFQNIAPKRNQLKQAWYRCNELIEGSRSARRINATYQHTKKQIISKEELPNDFFTSTNLNEINLDANYDFYIRQITSLFEQKNTTFFEPLDIWYIEELKELFVRRTGREPRPEKFPNWILILNNLRNYLRNNFCLYLSRIKSSL